MKKLKGYGQGRRLVPPHDAETIEMIDGRIYYSRDRWETAHLIRPGFAFVLPLTGQALNHARFLAITQASASPDWKKDR